MNRAFLLLAATALFSLHCGGTDSADDPESVGDANDELVASNLAGLFQNFDLPTKEGQISSLFLNKDKTFSMSVRGEYGCDVYEGFSCPSSWSDGRSGTTYVLGTWSASSKGIKLQPSGEGKKPSDPIPMTLTISGATATANGTIVPNRAIFGSLTVRGLFGKAHTAKNSDFTGTWTVTDADKDGDQPMLTGSNVYVGTKYTHTIAFDGSAKTYREKRSDEKSTAKPDGKFIVVGNANGTGPGVLLLNRVYEVDAPVIVSVTSKKMVLDVRPLAPTFAKLHAEKP